MAATRPRQIHLMDEATSVDLTGGLDQFVVDNNDGSGNWTTKRISAKNFATQVATLVTPPVDVDPTPDVVNAKEVWLSATSTTNTLGSAGIQWGSNASAANQATATSAGFLHGQTIQTSSTNGNAAYYENLTNKDTFFGWWHKFYAACTLFQTTTCRCWIGLTTTTSAALYASDNPGGVIAFRFSTNAGDTTWKAVVSDGTNQTVVDTGVAPTTTVTQHFRIEWTTNATAIRFYINNTLVATVSTNLPAASMDLRISLGLSTLTTVISKFTMHIVRLFYSNV